MSSKPQTTNTSKGRPVLVTTDQALAEALDHPEVAAHVDWALDALGLKGYGYGYGDGSGSGSGSGDGDGSGDGYGDGYGSGSGDGYGSGDGAAAAPP